MLADSICPVMMLHGLSMHVCRYCAQIKTVIRSSASGKVLHPTLEFTVNANCRKHILFAHINAIYIQNASFYQDRPGTNMGKTPKRVSVSQIFAIFVPSLSW
eukprot:COSAG06_NODE_210_length_20171_cov_14.683489_20_plen_102_part_00